MIATLPLALLALFALLALSLFAAESRPRQNAL